MNAPNPILTKNMLSTFERRVSLGELLDVLVLDGMVAMADADKLRADRRLQKATGATILLAFAERLPHGRGYVLRIEPMPAMLPDDKIQAAAELNLAVEGLVKKCPAQYLWSYNRYKVPRGVEAPPTFIH